MGMGSGSTSSSSASNAIRPVVEIDLSKVIISGDNETGYSIEPKT